MFIYRETKPAVDMVNKGPQQGKEGKWGVGDEIEEAWYVFQTGVDVKVQQFSAFLILWEFENKIMSINDLCLLQS